MWFIHKLGHNLVAPLRQLPAHYPQMTMLKKSIVLARICGMLESPATQLNDCLRLLGEMPLRPDCRR